MLTHEYETSELKKKNIFLQREYVEELCYTGTIGKLDCFDHVWYKRLLWKKKKKLGNLGNLVTLSCDQKVDAKQNKKECVEKKQIPE